MLGCMTEPSSSRDISKVVHADGADTKAPGVLATLRQALAAPARTYITQRLQAAGLVAVPRTALAAFVATKLSDGRESPVEWAARMEREAVVAWLQHQAKVSPEDGEPEVLNALADCIERGDHRG